MNSTKFNYLVLAIFLFLLISCKKDPIILNTGDFDTYIIKETKDQNIPAMSVLIFEEDQILYEKYYGSSNLEQNLALSFDHLFLLASVSKTVTATALLQLYDQGEFLLNDNINGFLPFQVKVPGETTDITFKMLLTHTSGIADGSALDGQYYYGQDSPVDLAYFLENYLVSGGEFYNSTENFHSFEPGTEHEYSNTGNALVALLVEKISGLDFNTYCKQNIFIPMGMNNTYWRLDEINQTIVQPYKYEKRKYTPIQHYTFTDYPNGGLRSNATDMFKFLSSFTQKGTFSNIGLLKPETVDKMLSPQISTIDNEVGLHMFLLNSENNLWGHDGGEQGVATIMAFNPLTNVGALIFTNQGDANLDKILVEAYKLGVIL